LVSWERGNGFDPTMAASLSSGCMGLINAGFSLRFEGFFLEGFFLEGLFLVLGMLNWLILGLK
jgi:hypothetical protein